MSKSQMSLSKELNFSVEKAIKFHQIWARYRPDFVGKRIAYILACHPSACGFGIKFMASNCIVCLWIIFWGKNDQIWISIILMGLCIVQAPLLFSGFYYLMDCI